MLSCPTINVFLIIVSILCLTISTASMIEDGPGSWKWNNLIFICPLNAPSVFSMDNLVAPSLSSFFLCLRDWRCQLSFFLKEYQYYIYHNVLFLLQMEIFVWKDWMCVCWFEGVFFITFIFMITNITVHCIHHIYTTKLCLK